MKITETATRLVLCDIPRGSLVFVASASFVLTIPFIAPEWRGFELWQRLAVVAIGVSHLAGGLFLAGRARSRSCTRRTATATRCIGFDCGCRGRVALAAGAGDARRGARARAGRSQPIAFVGSSGST